MVKQSCIPGQQTSSGDGDQLAIGAGQHLHRQAVDRLQGIGAHQIGRNAGMLLANRMKDIDLPVCCMVSEAVLKKRETAAPPRV